MVTFEPLGPYKVPVELLPSAKLIKEDLSAFWKKHRQIAKRTGCYIFSIRTGRAVVPYYVGMTTTNFESECFTDHKLKHYHRVIANYARGCPVMTFLVHPKQRGKDNAKAIEELENFLIQSGMAVNPDLRNVMGRVEPRWGIKGVIRSGRGAPSTAAKDFTKLMRIRR